jgi:RNA-binding protein 26
MIFDPETASHLKPWLVRALEPMYVTPNFVMLPSRTERERDRCDAEPGALSDYILALLKHNVSEAEMRKELTSQLEEFLEKGVYYIFCHFFKKNSHVP